MTNCADYMLGHTFDLYLPSNLRDILERLLSVADKKKTRVIFNNNKYDYCNFVNYLQNYSLQL